MKKLRNIHILMYSSLIALAICLLWLAPTHVYASDSYYVTGTKNYLALRYEPSYNQANEKARLYNGDVVVFVNSGNGTYWYVASLKGYGYVNKNYLKPVSTGSSKNTLTVQGTNNYLALRSAQKYDSSNEIGKLKNGQTVTLIRKDSSGYWLVYAPSAGKFGFVNADYLSKPQGTPNDMFVAVGMNNYLALRTSMSYNSENEIGKIHFGEPVEYIAPGNSEYCYVYAPTLGKYGYVNRDYLLKVANGSDKITYTLYTVKGVDNYLALRTARAYKSSNEIGKIKNGQKVGYVADGDSTYCFVYAPTLGKFGYVNKNYLK
jgi:hypothetical protein